MLFRIKDTSTGKFVGSIYENSDAAFIEANRRNYQNNCNYFRVVRFVEDRNW